MSCRITLFDEVYFLSHFQYLHCGDFPEQRSSSPELRAFVVATLKLVDLIKDIIAKASVFEEEDFQPLTYGFQLANDVSEVWQYRFRSFHGMDTKLERERFLANNQLWSNEIIEFCVLKKCQKGPEFDFQSQFSTSKIFQSFSFFFIEEYKFRGIFFVLTFFDNINFKRI